MSEIYCTCEFNQSMQGVGSIESPLAITHSLHQCLDGVGDLGSSDNQKCDFTTTVVSSTGDGPVYDVKLAEGLEFIRAGDTATIQHSGVVNPELSLNALGSESVWLAAKTTDLDSDISGTHDDIVYGAEIKDDESFAGFKYFTTYLNDESRDRSVFPLNIQQLPVSATAKSDVDSWSLAGWFYINSSIPYQGATFSLGLRDVYEVIIGDIRIDILPNDPGNPFSAFQGISNTDYHRISIFVTGQGNNTVEKIVYVPPVFGWVHVAVTFDSDISPSSSRTKLYVNNELQSSFYTPKPAATSTTLRAYTRGIASQSAFRLDDLRFFSDKVLSSSELYSLYKYRSETGKILNTYNYIVDSVSVIQKNCQKDYTSLKLQYSGGDNGDVDIDELAEEEVVVISEAVQDECTFTPAVTETIRTFNPQISFCYKTRNPDPTYVKAVSSSIVGSGKIDPQIGHSFGAFASIEGNGDISSHNTMCMFNKQLMAGEGDITSSYIDKYYGNLPDFPCLDKLYPSGDISSSKFINSDNTESNLYSYVDEGVYTGQNSISGELISDDGTFIQPSSLTTEATAFYKAEIKTPTRIPTNNRLILRAAGPISTHESTIPPRYNVSGILLEDKFGNLITQYEDIAITGDADPDSDSLKHNFTSYFLKPAINKAGGYEWQRGDTPSFSEDGGYTLSFTVTSEDPSDPFTFGFDQGFSQNFSNNIDAVAAKSLRISSFEICSSGQLVAASEDYLPVYMSVPETGRRIQKCFYPTLFPLSTFDTGLKPVLESGGINTWEDNTSTYSNTTPQGALELLKNITDEHESTYIINNDVVNDSGKLVLRFSHTSAKEYKELQDGAFGGDFDQNLFGAFFSPSGAFNTKNEFDIDTGNSYFVVDEIKLRVLARKTSGTDDYVFDVVGYSDDCLLNVTTPACGFLQNISGVTIADPAADTTAFYGNDGSLPATSGFGAVDDLALAGEAMSDRDQYFEGSGCDDHNKLTTYPVVNSTEFEWYEVPLKIYDDDVQIGKSRNYNISSMLERLYLDIYPLPSGAAISNIHLCVTYKPQDGINLVSQGGTQIHPIQDGRSEGSYFTTSRQSNDTYLNTGSGYHPLSFISGVPHAYTSPETLKTNYARRWRGIKGLTYGPFNVNEFGFSFYNPQLDSPLIDCYLDFSKQDGSRFTARNLKIVDPTGVDFNGQDVGATTPESYKNIGLRLSSGTMFQDSLPGYSGDYTTADWTSLASGSANFQNHELYGQIFDGYDTVVRFGSGDSMQFSAVDVSSGIALYARFIPDANVSGQNHNFYDRSSIFTVQNSPSVTGLNLGFLDGYLFASGNGELIQDTLPYSGYQYPLSVLLTYNENSDEKIRLYTDNELHKGDFTHLRATSNAVDINTDENFTLYFGYPENSISGLPMLACELGFSLPFTGSGTHIVESNPDRNLKQITASEFFDNQRAKFFDPDESHTNDNYKLWDYVNENTYDDWQIGDFKYCAFSPAFSIMQKRTGRDLVAFHIENDGDAYLSKVDLEFPQSVSSGVSYHSQIENDFLRFHLSDSPSNFYSTYKRISKNLPAGYNFAEKAMVVETVLEHHTTDEIVWNDGNVGPKLIVSLYTRNKDPYYADIKPNMGLINRVVHHIPASSCFIRLDTTFTHDSICDESEQWSIFPSDSRLAEFKEKYFSKDIDDMFVQYDIAYPSGSSYESDLYIHSSHVRAEDAFVEATNNSGILNLSTSGDPSPVTENLNLVAVSYSGIQESGFNLHTYGPFLVEDTGFNLISSGDTIASERLRLYTEGFRTISESGFNLIASGDGRQFIDASGDMQLFVHGHDTASGYYMPLSLTNTQQANIPEPNALDLFLFATDNSGIRNTMPLFVNQQFVGGFGAVKTPSGSLPLYTFATAGLQSRFINETVSLSIYNDTNPSVSENLNLTLYGDNLSEVVSTGSINLSVTNYSTAVGSPYVYWYNDNYGTGIELVDEAFTSKDADDEIRGVDLFGYGSCTGNSPDKAFDEPLVTDDTIWREKTCNEGGIFRATSTYTNLDVGYSGNYYGIRKYTGLTPNSPYYVQLNIKTGTTEAIPTPRNWEEWGYGTCGPDTIGDCCNDDCEDNINFSGVKLIGDYPYLSGDPLITEASGRLANDNYGSAVVVNKDLMVVGSPKHDVRNEDGSLIENAGAVFLYRRDEDVAGLQADWQLEDKLTLPSGYKKDYISRTISNLLCYPSNTNPEFCISGQKWNIGQEGRELGYSLDVAYSGDRQVVVAGAPKAAWTRTFDELTTSGIPVAMIVFTDKFSYNDKKIAKIHNTASKYDILYKYFSAPWNIGGSEFQPQLDIKLLLCHVHDSDQLDEIALIDNTLKNIKEDWIGYQPIQNLLDPDIDATELKDNAVSGIKEAFFDLFPRNKSAIYSGVPPIVGVFGDDTLSTSNRATYKAAMDEFLEFYQNHAYESGVVDLETGVQESGYVNKIFSDSFNWDLASVEILEDTLATGNLIEEDVLHYISSGVGQQYAQSNAYEFQIPPESGGRVYIFEKESGSFNFVQELISPDEDLFESSFSEDDYNNEYGDDYLQYGNKPNDRFGHSVSISENGEVISVGSPFSQEACRIYERDESENTRLYSGVRGWLVSQGKTTERDRYDLLISASGAVDVGRQIYNELNDTDKYAIRSDELYWGQGADIKLYKKVYDYHYSDIPYVGTWQFIINEFAGTSRLGYSTAVSEDGNMVAFGAPTDSFNEFDDTNVWYEQEDTWASYTNAGAVRVFEARQYYPHTKAVEFTKFGNLDRSVNATGDLSSFYDQMGLYFSPSNVAFERTAFDDIEIPKDAGLAFIITPEIDAASDEIIDNIKTWLSYGDRTLVLVGNDPIWEDNGLYFESNQIINKILEKLECRMRIVPAREEYESLQGCVSELDAANDRYNVVESFVPDYSHETYIKSPRLFAKGVADIKLDLSDIDLESLNIKSPCDELNTKCELPIKHLGDLRAQWNSECAFITENGSSKIEYKTNWPFHFDNANPAQQCSFYPEIVKPFIRKPQEDARPLLVAAEHFQPEPIVVEARSGTYEQCELELSGIRKEIIEGNTYKTYSFDENHYQNVEFSIQESATSTISGIFTDFSRGQFFDPDETNDRDGFIQAGGTSYTVEPKQQIRVVSPESVLATEETYGNSKVFIMASMLGETAFSLGKVTSGGGLDYNPNNKDQNIAFYNNLVMKDCRVAGDIDQIGDWTGRDSFKDAFEDSKLASLFKDGNHNVASGVVYGDSEEIKTTKNIVWVANPAGKPTARDVARLKTWLGTGDKKLVITYSSDQEIVNNVNYLCEELGLNTKPYYLEGEAKYFTQSSQVLISSNQQECCPINPQEEKVQLLDENNTSIAGCPAGYEFNPITANTAVEKVALIPQEADPKTYEIYETDSDITGYAYVPLKVGANTSKVIYFKDPVKEKYWENPYEFWQIDAQSSVDFAVKSGSGYRMFINWVSESEDEKYDITLNVDNVRFSPEPDEEAVEYTPDQGSFNKLAKTNIYETKTKTIDFRVPDDVTSIKLRFDTNEWRTIKSTDFNGGRPLTPRILSVSGCLVPINVSTITTPDTVRDIPVYEQVCRDIPYFIPEAVITEPETLRPISTLNDKYCSDETLCEGFDNQFIADGPVVAAEEFEHFTSFTNGRNRSRVVLITDSTIVQGKCPHYRNDSLDENQLFIRSLYPTSPEKYQDVEFSEADYTLGDAARKFGFVQKVRSPERGSAAKYYAASGITDLAQRYGLTGAAGNLDYYVDNEDSYDPSDVFRRFTPIKKGERDSEIEIFGDDSIDKYGIYPRYSGVVGGETYLDAGHRGGIPRIMEETGKDYLDWELLDSGGFPGDLFGYSVDIHENKLVVGSPFSAFQGSGVVSWSGVQAAYDASNTGSGLKLSQFGGPGSAYYYEKTGRATNAKSEFLPWEFKQKLKTNTLNVGIDNATASDLTNQKGSHNLPDSFVEEYAGYTDRFGYSVSVDSDFIAVGAPAHDFNTVHEHIYGGSAAFIRKEFSAEFDIPLHNFYDLGSSGDGQFYNSGEMVLNNGAIFTFRHELTNWFDRNKEWIFAEKIQQQGFSDRNRDLTATGGSENDFFGRSVSVHRAKRGDSDYVLVGGAPDHNFPTSGNHTTLELENAGAAYTYDAMLREQIPAIPNSGSYIDAQVFGSKPDNKLDRLINTVYQNVTGDSVLQSVSGIVFSNENGDLFLEVSGYDPAVKSFVTHRPYVESVIGESIDGTSVNQSMNLLTSGKPVDLNASMNLMLSGDPSAFVYNNMNLHVDGITGYSSGDMILFLSSPSGMPSGTLNLFVGTDAINQSLNLRTRGK